MGNVLSIQISSFQAFFQFRIVVLHQGDTPLWWRFCVWLLEDISQNCSRAKRLLLVCAVFSIKVVTSIGIVSSSTNIQAFLRNVSLCILANKEWLRLCRILCSWLRGNYLQIIDCLRNRIRDQRYYLSTMWCGHIIKFEQEPCLSMAHLMPILNLFTTI